MLFTRHHFVLTPLAFSQPLDAIFQRALNFELAGNWYLAGETYNNLSKNISDTVTKARVIARAASCFELAQDSRVAARFYEEAAQEVTSLDSDPQLAAELYNRAALQYSTSSEYFFAGVAWTRSAEEFDKVQADIINCTENLAPLPYSAFKSHICGLCFEAAGMAFEKVTDNERRWAVGTYWRAGKAYSKGVPNIQAFNGYCRALNAHARYYGTLETEQLWRSLPLSEEERGSKLNPIGVMETALLRCNDAHEQNAIHSHLQTNRQMIETFHNFSLELLAVGNKEEAGKFRVQQNERQFKIFIEQRIYGAAAIYVLWKLTSNYGESLFRWFITCALTILTFASLFALSNTISFNAIPPTERLSIFDYIYFSVITFSSLGYGDLHPVGAFGQILACTEVFFGLTMFGLLLSFIGNRFQRG